MTLVSRCHWEALGIQEAAMSLCYASGPSQVRPASRRRPRSLDPDHHLALPSPSLAPSMSPLASSTPTSSPDPINDLVFTPPPDAALPPSNQHQQQQRFVYAQQATPLSPSVRPPAKTRPVKVERSSQTVSGDAAESGSTEDEPDEDAQEGFGRSREEEQEVEQAVASDDGGGEAAADGAAVDDLTVRRSDDNDEIDKKSEVEEVEEQWKDLRPDWGEERLEDEVRSCAVASSFAPLTPFPPVVRCDRSNWMPPFLSLCGATSCSRKTSFRVCRPGPSSSRPPTADTYRSARLHARHVCVHASVRRCAYSRLTRDQWACRLPFEAEPASVPFQFGRRPTCATSPRHTPSSSTRRRPRLPRRRSTRVCRSTQVPRASPVK